MPPVERVQREINTAKCLGDKLFGVGRYDLATRAGLIGAYGYHNGKPLLIIIRTTGDFHPVKTFREFKRIYQFIDVKTAIVIIRTERVRAISFMGALEQEGYRVVSIMITKDEFMALSECRDDVVNGLINQIINALKP